MSKKRGVSAEEKRTRLLEVFHEKKEFFQLKELEKIAPKEKGITAASVKETLQRLVDDGLVDTDKIGGSVYYWGFPSKAINSKKRKIEELEKQYADSVKKMKTVEENTKKFNPEEQAKLKKLLENITDLQIERDELLNAVKKFRENDPKIIEKKRSQIQAMRDAANRWTDNIFCIRSWVKNKFNMEEKVLNKHFGIPDDLDYLE